MIKPVQLKTIFFPIFGTGVVTPSILIAGRPCQLGLQSKLTKRSNNRINRSAIKKLYLSRETFHYSLLKIIYIINYVQRVIVVITDQNISRNIINFDTLSVTI